MNEDTNTYGRFFIKAMLWVAIFAALTVGVSIIVSLIFTDFVHGNPHRSKSNAVSMMESFPLIMGFVAIIGVFIVFSLSQAIQVIMLRRLYPAFGRCSYLFIALATPLITIVTWYSYDYLTPSDFSFVGADWVPPYQHGLSFTRYFSTLAYQFTVTTFSLLYFDCGVRKRSKKSVLLGALFLTIIAGALWGYHDATVQYHFIDNSIDTPSIDDHS
ncbi:hypothetical protein [Pantoea allii]|uniref:hypothetical protein n=1 Tax=Pantoea allii TaxID=574096 RepID=UPI001F4ED9BF|nr:hypothetical protein [Pantoea allii]MCH9298120.1 hypothetical protein [Pantoea allii]MDJ0038057.1 hypothetical protein [Pantoea allii]MDJ0091615.1 hypothetical protein [Pantoea allii]